MDASPLALRRQTTLQLPASPFQPRRRIRAWKLKLRSTWRSVKTTFSRNLLKRFHHRHRASSSSVAAAKKLSRIAPSNPNNPQTVAAKRNSSRPHKSLARLLEVPYTASDFIDWGDHMTPTLSPKRDISGRWRELHGIDDWDGLLDPIDPTLRCEILKYGEFASATYDAFDFDPLSEFCGSCRYNRHKMLHELGLAGKHGYTTTRYIYAMSHVDVPQWLSRAYTTWSRDSNWMGYVAVSDDAESKRIGRRDIVVAWRGTVAPSEWFSDLNARLVRVNDAVRVVKVQKGFLSVYKSKAESTRYSKASASEQVTEELLRLVRSYREKGEAEISITVTGHSLGGALSLLTAYEAASLIPDVYISVISFGAPRVGNLAFREKMKELGVKVLRVEVEEDIVRNLPGIVMNTVLKKLSITKRLNWIYRHVGKQLKLHVSSSPYLKKESDMVGSHNLEVYLHLVDGFVSRGAKYRWNARRDLALVNKNSDMLIPELKIPQFWYHMPYKGLVRNRYGRWVKPGREPEDIPSPFSSELSCREPILELVEC
ncbi:unnamed protein product [Linum trigynum]|uniref:Fungal lipase-type domain-containing protein n=1 Tax=Linum trigynum TaxID=586398 RepID=A0AAV2FY74_9ROSI